MSRTLKSTGVAANVVWVLAVDDDGTTIKLWTTPGATTGWTAGSGITLGGSSPPSVTTGKTWNTVARDMVHFGANSLLTITTPVAVSSPLCFGMVVKDFNAQGNDYIVRGSATAGGSADGSGPSLSFNGTPLLVMRNVDAGIALSLSLHSWAANEDVSWALQDIASGDNKTYLAAEGAALSGVNYTVTDPSVNFSNVYAKFIGSGTTPAWSGDVVVMYMLSAAISEAEAAAIHDDPIGTFFEADATNYSCALDAGTYDITGAAVTLTYTPASGGTAYSCTLDAGVYTISGQAASKAISTSLAAGSYSISGQDLTLTYEGAPEGPIAYSVELEAGEYTISGKNISLFPPGSGIGRIDATGRISLRFGVGLK